MTEKMLAPECITASTAIESLIKKLYLGFIDLQMLAKQQYDIEWDNFEKPCADSCSLDIFKRLDLWCRIDDVCNQQIESRLRGLLPLKELVRETEKALSKG